jgi:hypothetical protein
MVQDGSLRDTLSPRDEHAVRESSRHYSNGAQPEGHQSGAAPSPN